MLKTIGKWLAGIKLKRSPHWEKCSKDFLAANPVCIVCGQPNNFPKQAHHEIPFHFLIALGRPDLECDERILVPACVETDHDHHCLVLHLGDYQSWNPHTDKASIAPFVGKTANEIKSMPNWQKLHAAKPKHLNDLSTTERQALRSFLDHHYPPRHESKRLAA